MFPIILVFILRESVNRSNNPTSQRNMNSRIVWLDHRVQYDTAIFSVAQENTAINTEEYVKSIADLYNY